MVLGNKDFNVRLISLVQAHPVIWNRNDLKYRSSRNRKLPMLMAVWDQIARDLGEGMTADMCSAKWANLRCNYSRYLRNMANGNPGKFYLSEEMEFLKPHMDVKLPEENVPTNSLGENEEENMEQDNCESSDEEGSEPVVVNFWRCKHMVVDSQNMDAVFLLSLLPEMSRMNPVQKLQFKQGALELCQLILD